MLAKLPIWDVKNWQTSNTNKTVTEGQKMHRNQLLTNLTEVFHCEFSCKNKQSINIVFRISLQQLSLCNVAAISCGLPHSVGNGSFHANRYTVGSQVTYHCNHGYHLDPGVPMTAVCLEDGSWNNAASPPRCLRKYLIF